MSHLWTAFQERLCMGGQTAQHSAAPGLAFRGLIPEQGTTWSKAIRALVPDAPPHLCGAPALAEAAAHLSVLTLALLVHRSWVLYSYVQKLVLPRARNSWAFLLGPCIPEAYLAWKTAPLRGGTVGSKSQPPLFWNPQSLRDLPSILRAHSYSGWGVISSLLHR